MTTIDNEKVAKSSNNYYCENCDYKTDKKCNFDKHLLTSKHIKTTNSIENVAESSSKKYTCDICNKFFHDRAGLWRHNKKCNNTLNNQPNIITNNTTNVLINLITNLVKENSEFKNMLMVQTTEFKNIVNQPFKRLSQTKHI